LVGSGPTGLAVGESVDGPVSTARLDRPAGLVFLHDGSLLFAESSNRIRGISPEGEVFTWLGDGSHSSEDGPLGVATVWYPVALALAPDGTVYFTEHGTGSVRRVRDGQVETLAGRTTGIEGSADQLPGLDFPSGLAVRPDGAILVADTSRHRLLVLESDGILRLLAGGVTPGHRDGSGWDSLFNLPTNVLVSPGGNILVADSGNSVIREIVWD
ncbi:MAG TPA: hypothetical protein PJ994_05725, partial [Tepidiformaceae bacterium]|nr:hypothetical protein [Tepidiformaceae bacterium]